MPFVCWQNAGVSGMLKRRYEWRGQSLEFTLQPLGRGWKLTLPDGATLEVEEAQAEGSMLTLRLAGAAWRIPCRITADEIQLMWRGVLYRFGRPRPASAPPHTAVEGSLTAPMPGLITRIFVQVGQTVQAGDRLLILEAMKTEQALRAPFDGIVQQINAREGEIVQEGTILVEVAPHPPEEDWEDA